MHDRGVMPGLPQDRSPSAAIPDEVTVRRSNVRCGSLPCPTTSSCHRVFDEGSDIGSDVVEVFDEARIDNFGVTLAWLQDYLFN